MANKAHAIKLGIDLVKNQVNTEFANVSKEEQMEVFRQALIEANGGSDKYDYRRAKRYPEVFEIMEEILKVNDIQGFEDNDFFEEFVEYHNKALGDTGVFYIPDNSLFAVNKTAEGVGRTLRQRINTGKHETIPTVLYTIEAYEEANRLLSGRINIVEFVERIRKSFAEKRANAIYQTFYDNLTGLPAAFYVSGTYVEADLLDIIAHVEASTGKNALLVGTKKALSKVTTAVVSESARERYNQEGFYGMLAGTPMMAIKQSHKLGTYDFAISDNDIWVVVSDSKPIKFVTEGDPILDQGNLNNADLTVDLFAGERWGIGIVLDQLYGQYRIS